MTGILIADIVYYLILLVVCLRIIYDTNSSTKTLAYLLLAIFVPFVGMVFYFIVGINYRKRKIYSKKLIRDEALRARLREWLAAMTESNLSYFPEQYQHAGSLVNLLLNDSSSPLTSGNQVKLLFNGENKFPELLHALEAAKDHIHIQYYIIERGEFADAVRDVLIRKAAEGVRVRFVYDDFGSRSIRGAYVRQLKRAGVEVFPFNKIRLLFLANRVNYRNHRRIVVIDGRTAFTGGINISDRYVNNDKAELYWRDTHIRIDGPGVLYLQYLFFCDWNFASGQTWAPDQRYFPTDAHEQRREGFVQFAASGPDSPTATILLSLLRAIGLARYEILITTPYFIPGETILDALASAALSGVKVRILVPGTSDSRLVNAAAWSYYSELTKAGVEIYMYRRGFVHAKTMVIDDYLSMVGTANMDYRSFDLNFEVNAIVYGRTTAAELKEAFERDLKDSEQVDPVRWASRPMYKQLPERIARLFSPLL